MDTIFWSSLPAIIIIGSNSRIPTFLWYMQITIEYLKQQVFWTVFIII